MSLTNSLPKTTYNYQIVSRDQLSNTSFEDLTTYRQQIDDDLTILFNHLQSTLKCDMNTSLLTLDGYPRSDIDVVQVRLCRSKIIKLQNDYKWISETLLDKLQSQLSKNQ